MYAYESARKTINHCHYAVSFEADEKAKHALEIAINNGYYDYSKKINTKKD